jgi:hypothetical protein
VTLISLKLWSITSVFFILFFVIDNTQYAGFLRICNTTFFDKDNTSVEVDHAHNNSIRIKKCFFGFIFTEGNEGSFY